MSLKWPHAKDPDENLYYEVDWSALIGDADPITGFTVEIKGSGDAVVGTGGEAPSYDGLVTRVWLSGGTTDTVIDHFVTTAAGCEYNRSVTLKIKSL